MTFFSSSNKELFFGIKISFSGSIFFTTTLHSNIFYQQLTQAHCDSQHVVFADCGSFWFISVACCSLCLIGAHCGSFQLILAHYDQLLLIASHYGNFSLPVQLSESLFLFCLLAVDDCGYCVFCGSFCLTLCFVVACFCSLWLIVIHFFQLCLIMTLCQPLWVILLRCCSL